MLGVARDSDAERGAPLACGTRVYSFPVTLDARAFAAALSTRNVIPLTITVDRQGRLREVIPGEMFEEDVLALAKLAR